MKKGFTLIEVLVSLIILSMIAVISSNILQSSLETERLSSDRLQSARKLNFSSITLKRDIRQIINVPLRDFYGNQINGTFIGNNKDNIPVRLSINNTAFLITRDVCSIKIKITFKYRCAPLLSKFKKSSVVLIT